MRMNIIGSNTGYSLSPAMHNAAYKACGMPHNYSIHQALSLNELHKLVEDPHYGGSSVTLPFKVEVIALTHSLSSHARTIGAINTLIPVRNLRPDGSIPDELSLFRERNRAGPVKALYGENTDWIGIKACLRRGLSPANAVGPKTSAIVIGAGGMARAAIYALIKMGVPNILIHNRTVTRAEELADHYRRVVARSGEPSPGPSSTPVSSSRQDTNAVFYVLHSRDDGWPERFRQATIVVSCVPTHAIGNNPPSNFTLPETWMKSMTGGVVLEVPTQVSVDGI
ncbi:hypothetical protein LTS18_014638 [Coniosporium uncinatum]|uniref:Uncharacterized protein n=1 Tax=Coniosporium uncinatum TaxID=93489 RepID=A0ACC3DGV7_9PEZI|nr:hypothetical protein LTS18_014638 [Coniosporium uncinatum]